MPRRVCARSSVAGAAAAQQLDLHDGSAGRGTGSDTGSSSRVPGSISSLRVPMIRSSAATVDSCSARMRWKIASRSAASVTRPAYREATARSAFASTISMFESTEAKKGHSRCISPEQVEPVFAAGEPGIDGGTEPVPAGQHQPTLRPCEYPRDGAQRLDRARLVARRWSAADVQLGDLADDRGFPEIVLEARRLIDEVPVGRKRKSRERLECREVLLLRFAHGVTEQCRLERGSSGFSRLRRPTSRFEYLVPITSPCSVMRIWPCTVPTGWARIAS